MNSYYKKCSKLKLLTDELSQLCLEFCYENLKSNIPLEYWYDNPTIKDYKWKIDQQFNNEDTGGVGLYMLPHELNDELCDYFKDDLVLKNNIRYYLQVVGGGKFVAPHRDPRRKSGFLYILKSGGPDVRTCWYEIKETSKSIKVLDGNPYSYDMLDLVENQCLDENTWHWFNFNKIHSVENQKTVRISLWGHEADYLRK